MALIGKATEAVDHHFVDGSHDKKRGSYVSLG
jgi:hypothetical protein